MHVSDRDKMFRQMMLYSVCSSETVFLLNVESEAFHFDWQTTQ